MSIELPFWCAAYASQSGGLIGVSFPAPAYWRRRSASSASFASCPATPSASDCFGSLRFRSPYGNHWLFHTNGRAPCLRKLRMSDSSTMQLGRPMLYAGTSPSRTSPSDKPVLAGSRDRIALRPSSETVPCRAPMAANPSHRPPPLCAQRLPNRGISDIGAIEPTMAFHALVHKASAVWPGT